MATPISSIDPIDIKSVRLDRCTCRLISKPPSKNRVNGGSEHTPFKKEGERT